MSQPNIVFLFIDDMGWKDVGFMGSEYYETPNIDRLAQEGMVFTDAYANAPNCAPSRACLMTGQYSPRHGIYTVNSAKRGPASLRELEPVENTRILDPDNTTIAEELQQQGYNCAHIGKWHLGEGPETGPEGRGFDVNVAGCQWGHPQNGYFSPYEIKNLKEGPEGEYLTDRLTEEALDFLEKNQDNPFFLYFSHYAVHTPLQAKRDKMEKYIRKEGSQGHNNPTYAAMIESTDDSVGRILDKLDNLGLTEDTIVIFFSDNGGLGGYQENGIDWQEITSQAPLRGGKGMLYEGGIREPLIVKWPGEIEPGSECSTPVIGSDFYPTFLDIIDTESEEDKTLDGESILPLLKQQGSLARGTIYWHFPAYLEGNNGTWRTTPAAALRHNGWKLIEFFGKSGLELYNLREDIGEENNLAQESPQITSRLYDIMKEWRVNIDAPIPVAKDLK